MPMQTTNRHQTFIIAGLAMLGASLSANVGNEKLK